MTKKDAMKVRVGDTVFDRHCRRFETVVIIITDHPDPQGRLPMFATCMRGDTYQATRRLSTYLRFRRV